MRRNMQNLSFLVIVSALMSCAFFFSQQTKSNLPTPLPQETEKPALTSIDDIPDCKNLESEADSIACHTEAASLSQQLLESEIDAILEM